MKTTVDIPEALLRRLRRRAAEEGTTLRALLNAAIQRFLGSPQGPAGRFTLKDGSFRGQGAAPGVQEGDWGQVRDLAYEGRGG
jgi:hypothetical protein